MPFITNDMPLDVDDVISWEESRAQRIETFKSLYSQDTAQRLIDAATQYHWVHPQITAALVLNGADYLLPDVGAHAAEKMADAGLSPSDRWRGERLLKAYQKLQEGGE